MLLACTLSHCALAQCSIKTPAAALAGPIEIPYQAGQITNIDSAFQIQQFELEGAGCTAITNIATEYEMTVKALDGDNVEEIWYLAETRAPYNQFARNTITRVTPNYYDFHISVDDSSGVTVRHKFEIKLKDKVNNFEMTYYVDFIKMTEQAALSFWANTDQVIDGVYRVNPFSDDQIQIGPWFEYAVDPQRIIGKIWYTQLQQTATGWKKFSAGNDWTYWNSNTNGLFVLKNKVDSDPSVKVNAPYTLRIGVIYKRHGFVDDVPTEDIIVFVSQMSGRLDFCSIDGTIEPDSHLTNLLVSSGTSPPIDWKLPNYTPSNCPFFYNFSTLTGVTTTQTQVTIDQSSALVGAFTAEVQFATYKGPVTTFQVSVIDCVADLQAQSAETNWLRPDTGSVLYENTEDSFVFANQHPNGGQEIFIAEALQQGQNAACGTFQYRMTFTFTGGAIKSDYLYESLQQDPPKIKMRSSPLNPGQCTYVLSAVNDHHTEQLQTGTLEWKTCENVKGPSLQSFVGVDNTSEIMIDFGKIPTAIVGTTMTPSWKFDAGLEHCLINSHRLDCTQPNGKFVKTYSNGSTDSNDSSRSATSPIPCDYFSFNINTGEITVDASLFKEADGGVYELKVEAYMWITSTAESNRGTYTFQKIVSPDCAKHLTITAKSANLEIDVTLGTEKILSSFNVKTYFDRNQEGVCFPQLEVRNLMGVKSSHFEINGDHTQLKVLNTLKNSDFSGSLSDRPTFKQTMPTFKLVYYLPGSTIEAQVDIILTETLDCSESQVMVVGKTFSDIFGTSLQTNQKTVIQFSDSATQNVIFQKVQILDVSNNNCDILNSEYKLVQRGYSTALNANYVSGDHDPYLVKLEPNYSASQIRIMLYSAHKIDCCSQRKFVTFDGALCDLDDISKQECVQTYELQAGSYTGKISMIAELTVTYKSECYDIAQLYAAASDKSSFWFWDPTIFKQGYKLRDTHNNDYPLPTANPQLRSGVDVYTRCGSFSYTITNPDHEIFFGLNESNKYDKYSNPTFKAYSENVRKVDIYKEGFWDMDYQFGLKAHLDLVPDTRTEIEYPDPAALLFNVQDACFWSNYKRTDWLSKVEVLGKRAETFVNRVEYYVMTRPAYYLVHFEDYKRDDQSYYHTTCGITLYEHGWSDRNVPQDLELWKVYEDKNHADDGIWYNKPDGSSPLAFTIYTDSNANVGKYTYSIKARNQLVNLPHIFHEEIFEIEIKPCEVEQVFANQEIELEIVYYQQPEKALKWDQFLQQPNCGYKWEYSVYIKGDSAIKIDSEVILNLPIADLNQFDPIRPPIIQYYVSEDRDMYLTSSDISQIDTFYDVYIVGILHDIHLQKDPGSDPNFVAFLKPFKLTVGQPYSEIFNTAPTIDFLPKTTIIEPGSSENFNFGEYYDFEGNMVRLEFVELVSEDQSIGGKSYSQWLQVSNSTRFEKIQIQVALPDDLEEEMTLLLIIVIIDDHKKEPLTNKYLVRIAVPKIERKQDHTFDAEKALKEREEKKVELNLPPPFMKIGRLDPENKITVDFDRPVSLSFIPTRMLQSLVSQTKQLDIKALEGLNNSNEGAKLFKIEYQPSYFSAKIQDKQSDDVSVDWRIVVESSMKFYIQIVFSSPELISRYEKSLDNIIFTVLYPEAFVADDGKTAIASDTRYKMEVATIVKQVNIDKEQVQQIGDNFAESVKAIMASNFIFSLIFAGALQYLWGMVNSLQLMVLAIFFNILLPENLQVILVEVYKACNFEFFPTEDVLNKLFDFGETESFSDQFETVDFDGSIFIISLGTLNFFIVGFLLWVMIKSGARSCCGCCCSQRMQSFFHLDSDSLPTFIIFLLESSVEIGFSCCISIKFISDERFQNPSEFLSSTLAYWFAVALLVAPIYLVISGCRLHYAFKANNMEEVEKYRSLFADKDIRSAYAVQHSTVFLARRYFLVTSIIFYPSFSITQLIATIQLAVFVAIYTVAAHPFEESLMTKQEVMNEILVCLATYTLFAYTELISDSDDLVKIGWVSIVLIVATILLNLLFMACITGHQSVRKCKLCLQKRKARKEYERKRQLAREQAEELKRRQMFTLSLFEDYQQNKDYFVNSRIYKDYEQKPAQSTKADDGVEAKLQKFNSMQKDARHDLKTKTQNLKGLQDHHLSLSPIQSALEISNIQAQDIQQDKDVVKKPYDKNELDQMLGFDDMRDSEREFQQMLKRKLEKRKVINTAANQLLNQIKDENKQESSVMDSERFRKVLDEVLDEPMADLSMVRGMIEFEQIGGDETKDIHSKPAKRVRAGNKKNKRNDLVTQKQLQPTRNIQLSNASQSNPTTIDPLAGHSLVTYKTSANKGERYTAQQVTQPNFPSYLPKLNRSRNSSQQGQLNADGSQHIPRLTDMQLPKFNRLL